MIKKFMFSSFKKEKLIFLFPLVYMIPVIILIYINIINGYGEIYQNYSFVNNSDFSYIYDEQPQGENSFFVDNWMFQGKLSKEKSIAGIEFYDTVCSSTTHFFYSLEALSPSYFTRNNLMKGQLPSNEIFKDCEEQRRYPICITYTMAKTLEVGIGDDIYYIYNYIDEKGVENEIRINLRVIGLLYPDGKSSSEFNVSKINGAPFSCAMVSKELLDNIVKVKGYSESPYIRYSNIVKEDYPISKNQIIENLPINDSLVFDAIFVVIVICIICSFTLKVFMAKFIMDTENLNKLGLTKLKISSIYFSQCTFILFISIAISVLFIRYFYIPFILIDYLDWIFLLSISVLLFIAGSIYNAIFSIIKTRFN